MGVTETATGVRVYINSIKTLLFIDYVDIAYGRF
jgi:hypothetical protein